MATHTSGRPGIVGCVIDEELGAFLRHRRSLRQPQDVGLPTGGRRRVPGLRREELAIVAGVSPDHYQRIEQGRVRPSPQVVDALATALALDNVERAHLHDLAGRGTAARSHSPTSTRSPSAQRRYQALADNFNGPAYVLDHRRDLIAWNRLAAALHVDFATVPSRDRNMIWLILTDPVMRELYPDWQTAARTQVGLLRRASARFPEDRRIHDLIGRLSVRSPEFERWWRLREVSEGTTGAKELRHPVAGLLRLDYHVLHPASAPGIEVFTYFTTDPETARKLDDLVGNP